MADAAEPKDPRPALEEKCKPGCVKEWANYEACGKRIEKDTTGEKHCNPWFLDWIR